VVAVVVQEVVSILLIAFEWRRWSHRRLPVVRPVVFAIVLFGLVELVELPLGWIFFVQMYPIDTAENNAVSEQCRQAEEEEAVVAAEGASHHRGGSSFYRFYGNGRFKVYL
jgi:hypothetical protein